MHKLFRPVVGIIILVAAGLIAAAVAFPFAARQIPSADPQLPSLSSHPQPGPAVSSSSTAPAITWSVPQFSATLFPGTSTTTTITFRSGQPLGSTTVDVTPSLSGLVAVAPTSFSKINANQDYTLTLTLAAPQGFQKRSFGGTIHIRNAATPPKTYDTPLPVNLQTDWNTLADASSGLTFALPLLGVSPVVQDVGSTSDSAFVIDVQVPNPSDGTVHSLLRILALPNASNLDIQQWFEQNIDDSNGTLLSSGAFQLRHLPNGPAMVSVGPFPDGYQGAPVAQAYLLSQTGDLVYTIKQSQDLQLTDFGYPPSAAAGVLTSILGSVR